LEKVQRSVETLGSPAVEGRVLDFMSDTAVREIFHPDRAVDHLVLVGGGAPRRGRVDVVSPGIIDTPLHDWLDPEDVAHAIIFLIQNPFTTGALLDIDGGIRLK